MILQVDTREHLSELTRITAQLDTLGVEYIRKKLNVGDYQIVGKPEIVVDRKKDLLELCGNITKQHKRFRAELLRAVKDNIKLVILCEHGEGITRLEDVYFWHNPRLDIMEFAVVDGRPTRRQKFPTATTGPQLYKVMTTLEREYNVTFDFCEKTETGKRILDVLRRKL